MLGLRFPPSFHFSTIPVIASTDSGGAFAHLAVGGGWTTTIELLNTTAAPVATHLQFYDDNGNPLMLPVTSTQAASSLDQTVGSYSTVVVQSSGGLAVQTGSARLVSGAGVSGFIRFRYDAWDQETIVRVDSGNGSVYTLAFDNTGGASAGVAIANLGSAAAKIPVTIRDAAGILIVADSITLPPNGHSSFTLTDRFPAAANQQGTVEFDSAPGGISALGIRFPASNSFTSIPAVKR